MRIELSKSVKVGEVDEYDSLSIEFDEFPGVDVIARIIREFDGNIDVQTEIVDLSKFPKGGRI